MRKSKFLHEKVQLPANLKGTPSSEILRVEYVFDDNGKEALNSLLEGWRLSDHRQRIQQVFTESLTLPITANFKPLKYHREISAAIQAVMENEPLGPQLKDLKMLEARFPSKAKKVLLLRYYTPDQDQNIVTHMGVAFWCCDYPVVPGEPEYVVPAVHLHGKTNIQKLLDINRAYVAQSTPALVNSVLALDNDLDTTFIIVGENAVVDSSVKECKNAYRNGKSTKKHSKDYHAKIQLQPIDSSGVTSLQQLIERGSVQRVSQVVPYGSRPQDSITLMMEYLAHCFMFPFDGLFYGQHVQVEGISKSSKNILVFKCRFKNSGTRRSDSDESLVGQQFEVAVEEIDVFTSIPPSSIPVQSLSTFSKKAWYRNYSVMQDCHLWIDHSALFQSAVMKQYFVKLS